MLLEAELKHRIVWLQRQTLSPGHEHPSFPRSPPTPVETGTLQLWLANSVLKQPQNFGPSKPGRQWLSPTSHEWANAMIPQQLLRDRHSRSPVACPSCTVDTWDPQEMVPRGGKMGTWGGETGAGGWRNLGLERGEREDKSLSPNCVMCHKILFKELSEDPKVSCQWNWKSLEILNLGKFRLV